MAKHQMYLETNVLEYLIELVKAQDDTDEKFLLLGDLIKAKSRVAGQRS